MAIKAGDKVKWTDPNTSGTFEGTVTSVSNKVAQIKTGADGKTQVSKPVGDLTVVT
jgi:preprotein translocase subunit YajC